MIHSWSHRLALGLAAGACALLASCGGGSTVSNVKTINRAISVGDGFQDVGQIGGAEYTVNDGSGNWLQAFVSNYGLGLAPVNGRNGWGYAQGYAQVATPVTDPNGNNVPSVTDQITALLARTTLTKDDLVFINGGMSDIVAAVQTTGISDATTATVKAAADALAGQVQRLVDAGATHVVVTGVYDLGTTPWAAAHGSAGVGSPISVLSTAFNIELLTQINHFSKLNPNPVLYFDAAEFFDFAYNSVAQGTTSNGSFGLTNVTTPVCTTPTAATCGTGTLIDSNYNAYLFADNLYFTPNIQHLFVNTSYAGNVLTLFQRVWGS